MNLTDPIFNDADAAREYLEASRWANGVFCPHCGGTEKCKRLEGSKHRPGLFQCGDCRKQFTVTVGTVFERSKVPLNKWMLATFLMASSKKGYSAHQLHRTIGVTYKTAWFMFHRIREAMRNDDKSPMGSGGGIVESDETFIGKDPKFTRYAKNKLGYRQKMKVLALVDRTTGKIRNMVIDHVSRKDIDPILKENVAREAHMSTEEASYYRHLGGMFAGQPDRQPRRGRVRARRGPHKHAGRLFLNLQARHEGHLPALWAPAPAPLHRRVCLPLQPPHRAGRRRHHARQRDPQGRGRPSPYLSAA